MRASVRSGLRHASVRWRYSTARELRPGSSGHERAVRRYSASKKSTCPQLTPAACRAGRSRQAEIGDRLVDGLAHQTQTVPGCSGFVSAVVFDGRRRAVLLDRVDGVLSAGLARIAFGRKHDFAVVLEANAELALLVLVDLKLVGQLAFSPCGVNHTSAR